MYKGLEPNGGVCMRRFEYGWIQSLSLDMDILSLIAGNLPGEWQGGGFAFTESCYIRFSCRVGKGTEYRGFKCD